jgi:MoaA/NifB/PqqE/SkfB family radical SAM enzyme
VRTPRRTNGATAPSTGISGKNSGLANLTPFRPQGDARIRKLLNKSLNLSEKEALAAFRRRWASTRYCQDMAELLAKLEGELNREGADGARGISVIVIRGDGAISPEEFRRNAEARMALEARR